MKRLSKCSLLLVLVLVFSMLFNTTFAHAYIDWGRAVYVHSAGQVVDSITVNGVTVDALYAPRSWVSNYDSNTTYACAAFVKRFYSSVYGVNVYNLYPGDTPLVSGGGGYFYRTSTPQVGDIAANSGHWAIVKAVSGNSVTLIEQNCWNLAYDSAMVGRVLTSESSYWFWRWSGHGDAPAEVSYQNLAIEFIDTKNVGLYGEIINPGRYNIPTIGVKIWDSKGNLVINHSEACNLSYSTIYQRLDVVKEAKADGLISGESYTFKMWANVNGKTYESGLGAFTMQGTKPYTVGDVNNDGKINAADALLVLKHTAKISSLSDSGKLAADASKDGQINAADALIILKYAAGILTRI